MIETINPYVMRIMIACRKEDSIRAISQRIGLSYGWTYKWVQELAQKGVVRVTRMNIYLNEDNEFYQKTVMYIKDTMSSTVSFYYEVISLFGINYCFTQTDAVYIWTRGGYNIARNKEYYPIHIKVEVKDKEIFEWYCRKIGTVPNKKKGIFYHPQYTDIINKEYCEGMPVDPLNTTISFMQGHIYNFMPALEMISEIYNKKIPIQYKEVVTNV